MVELEIDGSAVRVFEGSTILDACKELGIDTPVLCYGETLRPANVCRVCVVEVEGARARPRLLAEGRAGDGHQDGFGARSAQQAPGARVPRLLCRSLRDTGGRGLPGALRSGSHEVRPPAAPDPLRDRKRTGHHVEPDGQTAATVHAPVKVDNELYVRDYSKCILCTCVDACGEQYQNTFAIGVAGRGFDARISTEYVVELPESAMSTAGTASRFDRRA